MSGGASGEIKSLTVARLGSACWLRSSFCRQVSPTRQHPFDLRPADNPIRFSPLTAAQPLTILSWPEALNAGGSRLACRWP